MQSFREEEHTNHKDEVPGSMDGFFVPLAPINRSSMPEPPQSASKAQADAMAQRGSTASASETSHTEYDPFPTPSVHPRKRG